MRATSSAAPAEASMFEPRSFRAQARRAALSGLYPLSCDLEN